VKHSFLYIFQKLHFKQGRVDFYYIPTVYISFQESALSGEEDTYTDSHFHDVFNEDCIVLDPVSVLPLQYKITRNLLPLSGKSLPLLV